MMFLRWSRVFTVLVLTFLVPQSQGRETSHYDGSDLVSELASKLSPNASIVTEGDPRMQTEHQRWSAYSSPTYSIVVEVAVEKDVQTTVLFANKHSLPFLAVDGAHGYVPSLGRMRGGIAISFTKMKDIVLSPDGKSISLEPGINSGDIVRTLWAQGKQTTTGTCLCAGALGIMLGGGHGFLQGLHGYPADQILEARVVLADGRWVTASPKSNSDLFWALRGAGHNFGIITSLKYKVYDAAPGWSVVMMTFSQDKLEEIFDLANDFIDPDDNPAELSVWYDFARRPDLDSSSATIGIRFIYQGELSDLEPFVSPFRSIGPLVEDVHGNVPYPEVFDITSLAEDSESRVCDKGIYRNTSPVYTLRHNATSMRRVHSIFDDLTTRYPDVASFSAFVSERYPTQGVMSVPSDSTAAPHRKYQLLISPLFGHTDPAHTDDVIAAAKEMRKAVVEGSGSDKLHAYVNYATGDESLREVYGYEPWRQRKLKDLKKKYDPEGRFNFYVPIEV